MKLQMTNLDHKDLRIKIVEVILIDHLIKKGRKEENENINEVNEKHDNFL